MLDYIGSARDGWVQLRALKNAHTVDGVLKKRKTIFWAPPDRAKHYIDFQVAEPVMPAQAPAAGPSNTPQGSPSENTMGDGGSVKKSSPGDTDSLMTGSALSDAQLGPGALLSVQQQGRASTLVSPQKLLQPLRNTKTSG